MTVTLWGRAVEEQGAQLEALPHPLVSISQCRVTDYNGMRPGLRPLHNRVTDNNKAGSSWHMLRRACCLLTVFISPAWEIVT